MEEKFIKFALPLTIQCSECQFTTNKGEKVHSTKTKSGEYFEAVIYEVKFKCRECGNPMVLKYNPELLKYEAISGCSRFLGFQRNEDNKINQSEVHRINQILKNNEKWKDDAVLNQILRKRQREKTPKPPPAKKILKPRSIFNT